MRDTQGKNARRYRKISPIEWAYLSAAAHFPPFAIQLRIETESLPPLPQLERALAVAAAANPGARLTPSRRWWFDNGRAPKVRVVSGTESFSLAHPHLHEAFPFGDTPAIEVLYWQGCGLIFRCSHALMDAGGLLFFAQETFRALRGEPLLGTSRKVSDHEFLAELKHPRRRLVPKPDQKSPVCMPTHDQTGFVWEQRFIPGLVPAVGARIAAALGKLTPNSQAHGRVMLPVDLRKSDTSLRSTANLSSPLFLALQPGATWDDYYRDVIAGLRRRDQQATSSLDGFVSCVPKSALGSIVRWLHQRQVRNDQYLFSATISNIGTVSLSDFSAHECVAKSIAQLPFDAPGSAITLDTIQHDNGLEIAVSCPAAAGGGGRLTKVLDLLCAELKQAQGLIAEEHTQASRDQSIVIASTFVAEPLESILAFWMKQFDLPDSIQFAPYNQVLQTLINPQGPFATNRSGANLVLLRAEDWIRHANKCATTQDRMQLLQRNAEELISAIGMAVQQTSVPLMVFLSPLSRVAHTRDLQTCLEETQRNLLSQLSTITGVYNIAPTDLQRYPVEKAEDEYADKLGHIPYTRDMYAAMATLVARKIVSMRARPYKVIVLDCDNTLWQGVCGEAENRGISVTPAHQALQEFMLAQHDEGMLLCLCSKNNPEDVYAVFEQCTDMRLNQKNIVASRINWQPKSRNIKSLAQELQLGLDSFIFIDDNPVECAEVRANCEGVLVLQLPEHADAIPVFLRHVWAFDRSTVTGEARQRTLQYQQNKQREALRSSTISFESFLASLDMKVDVSPMQAGQLERVAELTRRTNQFNLRPRPRQASEIQALTSTAHCLTIDVHDRFGAYGLTGVVIYEAQGDLLKVDTFLLSCRVLGRGVEHRVLIELGRIARQAGCTAILLTSMRTAKNQPVFDFLESIAADVRSSGDKQNTQDFTISVEQAASVAPTQPTIGTPAREPSLPTEDNSNKGAVDNPALIYRIARDFHTVAQIIGASVHSKGRTTTRMSSHGSSMQGVLTGILMEVSGNALASVSPDKSLMELGLDSLQMVMLLTLSAQRIAPGTSQELLFSDLDDFIREPTLRRLAQHLQQLRATNRSIEHESLA